MLNNTGGLGHSELKQANVLVLLRELSILLLRTDARDAALDALLDLFELVRGHVNVLGGVQEDVAPGGRGQRDDIMFGKINRVN